MRHALRLALVALLLAGCTADPAVTHDPPDAGSDCPDGGVKGPLGICIERNACDDCLTDVECGPGATCGFFQGCHHCSHRDPGPGLDGGSEFCAPPGNSCRDQSTCCAGMMCRFPDDPPMCGICRQAMDECTSDPDCGDGAVCVEQPTPPCSCSPGTFKTCVKRCQDGDCAPGDRCLATGACAPISCHDGFACDPVHVCDPASAEADPHGCTRRACTTDGDCAGGICSQGRCAAHLGVCQPPPP